MARKIKYIPKCGDLVGECIFVKEDGCINLNKRNLRAAIFICSYCKKEFRASFNRVNTKEKKSCGCYRVRELGLRSTTHGLSKSHVYAIWTCMKGRCHNPKSKRFYDYGGRGIKVCERWYNSFENFLEDMGDRPSREHSVERRDNNGDYEPNNCYWATKLIQANNKRNSRVIEFNGKSLTISQWARELGINVSMIDNRIRKKWDIKYCLCPTKFKTGSISHERQKIL